jgi:D-3-phosphoglycerate dehydrogenase / 2-oxoglutarate reductase
MKILVTAPYLQKEWDQYQDQLFEYEVDIYWLEERMSEKDLLACIHKYDGIICGDDPITKDVINKSKKLKVISKWGTGINSIDVKYAEAKGIKVCRTPNAFTIPVSESTLGLMLNLVRKIKVSDNLMTKGKWFKPYGTTLNECAVGIVGFGNIGQEVAKKLSVFGCEHIFINDIKDYNEKELDLIAQYNLEPLTLKELLNRSDIVTLHCDLNETSWQIATDNFFNEMKTGSYFINTARGGLVKEIALIKAIEQGILVGVGLDVFEEEPLAKDSPLRKYENCILSSHNTNNSPRRWKFVQENTIRMLKINLNGNKS